MQWHFPPQGKDAAKLLRSQLKDAQQHPKPLQSLKSGLQHFSMAA
jgi:hypothetical protein